MKINVGAEQAALGCILVDPSCAAEVLAIAPPDMFGVPKHADLASVLSDMATDKDPIDPQTVLDQLTTRGLAGKIGGGSYLITLMERAWSPSHATAYAEQIRDAHRFRRATETATRLVQRLESPDADLNEIIALHLVEVDQITDLAGPANIAAAPNITALLNSPGGYDWLVDGLLERGDRFMLTGSEGHGKSVLMRQLAVCLAAGLHPFTARPIPPVSVLVVDCENSRRQNRRMYAGVVALAERMAANFGTPMDHDRLRVEHRLDGLDLAGRDDPIWLDRLVAASRPDVLVIGPLYKMHRQNINDEQAARQLVTTLDTIRVRHGVAMLMEAHAGHAEDAGRNRKMRPTGSSLFLRWPEFGYGLRRSEKDPKLTERPMIVDLVGWRGARDERDWPTMLRRGQSGSMPWIPHDPSDTGNYRPRWGDA